MKVALPYEVQLDFSFETQDPVWHVFQRQPNSAEFLDNG